MSFTKAILDNFVTGIKEAGHQYEIIDLHKIKFNPIFKDKDFSFFVDEEMHKDLLRQINLRKMIIELAGGSIKRLIAKWWLKNKTDKAIIKLIKSQYPKDVLLQQKKVAKADVLVFIM